MKRFAIFTLATALLIGVILAMALYPTWALQRAIARSVSDDPQARETAWRMVGAWLNDAETEPELAPRLQLVDDALRDASDDALLECMIRLDALHIWSWRDHDRAIMCRALIAGAETSDEAVEIVCLEELLDLPADASSEHAMPVLRAWLKHPTHARTALDVALTWLGPERVSMLRDAQPEAHVSVRDLITIALDLVMPDYSGAVPRLYADEHDVYRSVAHDRTAPLDARRLAGWRLPEMPVSLVMTLLEHDIAGEGGTVILSVLLAERHLPHDQAMTLAEQWIRSFNDAEKRAGALLAMMIGEHTALLQRAHDMEDQREVQQVQQFALEALGVPPLLEATPPYGLAGPDQAWFANPEHLLCALCGHHWSQIGKVALWDPDQPTAHLIDALLIERFMPHWVAANGLPTSGDAHSARAWTTRMALLRSLYRTRLELDCERLIYVLPTSAASGG